MLTNKYSYVTIYNAPFFYLVQNIIDFYKKKKNNTLLQVQSFPFDWSIYSFNWKLLYSLFNKRCSTSSCPRKKDIEHDGDVHLWWHPEQKWIHITFNLPPHVFVILNFMCDCVLNLIYSAAVQKQSISYFLRWSRLSSHVPHFLESEPKEQDIAFL